MLALYLLSLVDSSFTRLHNQLRLMFIDNTYVSPSVGQQFWLRVHLKTYTHVHIGSTFQMGLYFMTLTFDIGYPAVRRPT